MQEDRDDVEELWVGRIVDARYRLTRLIARGGMGVVFEGIHLGIERRVAIKFLPPDMAASSTAVSRFHHEARLAQSVARLGVVEILDLGEDSTCGPYIVMEFLEGESLQDYVTTLGPMTPRAAIVLTIDLLKTLAAVHEANIIHRDLKPANVFLAYEDDGLVSKILDFGIARAANQLLTRPGTVLGTPQYMAPEQARAQRGDRRSDLFAMGSILYYCLTAEAPLPDLPTDQLVRAAATSAPRLLKDTIPSAPAALAAAVDRARAFEPRDRFADAKEMTRTLLEVLNELSPTELDHILTPESDTTDVSGSSGVAPSSVREHADTERALAPDAVSIRPARQRRVFLDKLEVRKMLGRGAMGAVYHVRHRLTGQDRALKVLHAKLAQSSDLSERFLREAAAAGRMSSPFVPEIYDAGVLPDGRPYLLMELVRGETLSEAIRRRGPVPWRGAIEIARQIALGIQALHDQNILHRDVKTSNILLMSRVPVRIKLLDFGVVHFGSLGSEGGGTAVVGTPGYMAPEQRAGHPPNKRMDVFGAGMCLLQMLTGTLAEDTAGRDELTFELEDRMPSRVLMVLRKALATDPNDRFASASEFAHALQTCHRVQHRRMLGFGAAGLILAALASLPWLDIGSPAQPYEQASAVADLQLDPDLTRINPPQDQVAIVVPEDPPHELTVPAPESPPPEPRESRLRRREPEHLPRVEAAPEPSQLPAVCERALSLVCGCSNEEWRTQRCPSVQRQYAGYRDTINDTMRPIIARECQRELVEFEGHCI